ncbi:MAG: DMT family transporter [Lachnospiraceae bacterium]|nr:DMT family transporter [Lachnospiraceae bacterium]
MTNDLTNHKKKPMSSHMLGIMHIILAALGFSLMSLFLKMAGDVPTMQKAFFRNIVTLGLAIFLLCKSEERFHIKKGNVPYLLLRSIGGTIGLICNFWAIDHLALADANILNKMSPFFSMLMSIFILKEKPNKVEWLTIIAAFIGALFVVKPTSGLASLPAVVGLIGGFSAGTAYTYIRKLGERGERGNIIVFVFSSFSTIITLPFILFDYHPMTLIQFGFLILAGLGAMMGQLNITAAYTYAPAKEISVFDYTQVVFAAMWGFLTFGEIPDGWSFLGYVIIIGMALLKWYYVNHMTQEG